MSHDTATQQATGDGHGRAQESNGLAIAGFVCGLVSLVFFALILGPLGIVFGGIGLQRANRGARHKGLAIAGIVLGAVGLVGWIVLLAASGGSFSFTFGS